MPLPLVSFEERQAFLAKFPQLVEALVCSPDFEDMSGTNEWLSRVLNYNVPHGKRTRGLLVVLAFKCFAKRPSNDETQLCYILGWCVEMLQAACLVFDDMMDQSEERRGQKCWYLVDGIGQSAINDGLLLEQAVYKILRLYFRTHDRYADLVDLFHDITLKTAYGQSLDTHTSMSKNLDNFDFDLYGSIVKYKTSFYSFVLPVTVGMILAGIRGKKLFRETESVLMDLGYLYQMQDDHLDVFGQPEVTGKVGTDIQEGKCSWLLCKFLKLATPDGRKILMENYGKEDPECQQKVKELFMNVDLPGHYKRCESKLELVIGQKIQKLSLHLPPTLFHNVLTLILGRMA